MDMLGCLNIAWHNIFLILNSENPRAVIPEVYVTHFKSYDYSLRKFQYQFLHPRHKFSKREIFGRNRKNVYQETDHMT